MNARRPVVPAAGRRLSIAPSAGISPAEIPGQARDDDPGAATSRPNPRHPSSRRTPGSPRRDPRRWPRSRGKPGMTREPWWSSLRGPGSRRSRPTPLAEIPGQARDDEGTLVVIAPRAGISPVETHGASPVVIPANAGISPYRGVLVIITGPDTRWATRHAATATLWLIPIPPPGIHTNHKVAKPLRARSRLNQINNKVARGARSRPEADGPDGAATHPAQSPARR